MKYESLSPKDIRISQIEAIFPEAICETVAKDGSSKKAIDIAKLQALLQDDVDVVGLDDERYEFSWPGKHDAYKEANSVSYKTLKPVYAQSKDWDTTHNIYIEGDNLEALKLLQESYFNSIKAIYIDPPYNTGRDFVYNDNFVTSKNDYVKRTNKAQREQNHVADEQQADGRFHAAWCSMMYPRLILARNLLRDDGVIFISIDDNERGNLEKICNEIFGEKNYVMDLIRKTKSTTNDAKTGINIQHENCLVYAKDKAHLNLLGRDKDFSAYKNPDNDPNGPWTSTDPSAKTGRKETGYFGVENPYTGKVDYPPEGRFWLFSKNTIQNHIDSGRISFKRTHSDTERGFIYKRYLKNLKTTKKTLDSLAFTENKYMNQVATKELRKLDLVDYFSYPKSVNFIKELLVSATDKDSIVMDFFSGSATAAHATMSLNAEDGGNRRFIMVQLPEPITSDPRQDKPLYDDICKVGQERMRRAEDAIKEEYKDADGIDYGFRVFRIDESCIQDMEMESEVSYMDYESHALKDDCDFEDLFIECILKNGFKLDSNFATYSVDGKTIYSYDNDHLLACFDENVTDDVLEYIAGLKPSVVLFGESSFGATSDIITAQIYLANLLPDAQVKLV